jgi:hypothetical protein
MKDAIISPHPDQVRQFNSILEHLFNVRFNIISPLEISSYTGPISITLRWKLYSFFHNFHPPQFDQISNDSQRIQVMNLLLH